MLTLTCLDVDGRSQPADVKYMMSGLSGKPIDLDLNANPDPERFTEKIWESILHLSNL